MMLDRVYVGGGRWAGAGDEAVARLRALHGAGEYPVNSGSITRGEAAEVQALVEALDGAQRGMDAAIARPSAPEETDREELERLMAYRVAQNKVIFDEQRKMAENKAAIQRLRAAMAPAESVHAPANTKPAPGGAGDAAPAAQTPFHALLEEIRDIHDRKNRDYADSADPFKNFRECEEWGIAASYGCFTRMGDKWRRAVNLMRRRFLDGGGPAVAGESVEDTLLDLGIYALIAVLLLREERESSKEGTPRSGAQGAK